MPLVREERSRDKNLVSYGPHELLDRRERARLTSCAPFGSHELMELGSSKPAITTILSTLNNNNHRFTQHFILRGQQQQQPGTIVLAAILLDVRRPLLSSENIDTILGILSKPFAGFGRKSFVWGSLLLCISCQTMFVALLENANGLIICLPSAKYSNVNCALEVTDTTQL